jgi:hypothetical protein
MRKSFEELIGEAHGRLTITSYFRCQKSKRVMLNCLCECGQTKSIDARNLKRTRSCGCLRTENLRQPKTHGFSNSKLYMVWANIKTRCYNPNATAFEHYGGRGIKMCDRWKKFENFLADMGVPKEGMTIERIDVNGNYEPSNCKWASFMEQGANKRNSRMLTVYGERMHLSEAARRYGVKMQTIWRRLKYGWDDESAATKPPRGKI